MSKTTKKLSTLKLTDGEKSEIAQMVETPGFKIWVKKIIPQREMQIALTNISVGNSERDLWYNKGMVYENGIVAETLQGIADKYNKQQLDEDAKDES